MRPRRSIAVPALLLTLAACGDRAPPALWPEPPPPTLAKPIGIEDPASMQASTGATDEDDDAAARELAAAEAARAAALAKLPRDAAPDGSGSTGASSGATDTGAATGTGP